MRSERGQAGVEWLGLVLLCSLALGALGSAVPVVDGRSFGGFLAHRIVCAVKGERCDDGDAALARAYGRRDAALVRANAPGLVYEPGEAQLPVDWRRCRARRCADAPDDRALDAHRSSSGEPATIFTRRVRRGGTLYIQYWFYYPDSNTTFAASDKLWRRSPLRLLGSYPGFHLDDWEGYSVRIGPDGRATSRSTSHGGWQYCKSGCVGRWGPSTGWTRVSRGSHSGHVPVRFRRPAFGPGYGPRLGEGAALGARRGFVPLLPGRDLRERTTTAAGTRLVPLETVRRRRYRPLDRDVRPPWGKGVYRDPASGKS